MKISPRFSARRIAQGGATFAAFGALSIAAAMPAAADTTYGWGYATATGGAAEAMTDVTQSGSASDATGGVIQVDDCFSLDAETTATVNASGVTATTVINSASIKLTQDCFDELPEEEAPEPTEPIEDEDDDETEGETPEESDAPTDGADDAEGDDESPEPTETPAEGEGDDTEGETPEQTPAPEGEGDDAETQDPEPTTAPTTETASEETTEVVTLDEENSTTVSANGDLIADVSVSGASVTTTQSWDGDVDYSLNPGSSEGGASVYPVHYVEAFEDDGVTWNDGITDLYVTFTVEEAQVTYYLGTTAAAVATVEDGEPGGENPGGEEPGDGDEQNPPARDEEPEEEAPEPKSVEPLPQTGSPVIGLIGAGAAIAVGGGAAAFLARRKKTAATAEENGEG
ncbi:LPXTG cell wall anchor domain-containing protein [Nocardiopsis aegyptia]|uniref:LPXTG-motif cell wall-anchored protein n=1 Tax=Nocardiopsis aegyptia TaxID=220378 RepID=A0A7Z0EP63_9ACTN|nr:LPXTG cell wall anchor domain-containing protein [Nocardiopsis aegyptia]NYJ35720.1 LPXTG-motif cell wall-anchored protein [Nocardiopsis aegyptia]